MAPRTDLQVVQILIKLQIMAIRRPNAEIYLFHIRLSFRVIVSFVIITPENENGNCKFCQMCGEISMIATRNELSQMRQLVLQQNLRITKVPPRIYLENPDKSFTTSPAMISPATAGQKAEEPGTWRRSAQVRAEPGGQTQPVLQLLSSVSRGVRGGSWE
jgi:hypothetical protein